MKKACYKIGIGKGQARPGWAAGLGSPAVAHPEERKPRDLSETVAVKAFESSRAPQQECRGKATSATSHRRERMNTWLIARLGDSLSEFLASPPVSPELLQVSGAIGRTSTNQARTTRTQRGPRTQMATVFQKRSPSLGKINGTRGYSRKCATHSDLTLFNAEWEGPRNIIGPCPTLPPALKRVGSLWVADARVPFIFPRDGTPLHPQHSPLMMHSQPHVGESSA